MVLIIEDGSMAPVSELLSSDVKDPKGQAITFTQVGSTNTYTATVALNDGSGRNQLYRFDKPADPVAIVSRKVV
jgi:hypothetical protein